MRIRLSPAGPISRRVTARRGISVAFTARRPREDAAWAAIRRCFDEVDRCIAELTGYASPDKWSSPDDAGFLRDDNSLIKALPRSLLVRGPKNSHISGARLGTEFVAAHVWRVVGHEHLASRLPLSQLVRAEPRVAAWTGG
jgi:hypothetical protein